VYLDEFFIGAYEVTNEEYARFVRETGRAAPAIRNLPLVVRPDQQTAFLDLAVASADLSPEYRVGVLSNVVSHEENVRAVLSKVALAEADAGIVYASDAAGEPRVRMIEIPQSMNPEIMYPIAVLLDAPEAGLALTFVEFVRSTSGAAILLRHGFTPAGE